MRIKSILLSWFRGAADVAALEPDCRSMVIYGCNGSGKSCFIDAIEYVICNGRIDHLAHEYSGKRQEKAVPNTHTPTNEKCRLVIKFADDSEHNVEITKNGVASSTVSDSADMPSWEYRRTVLRQHEISDFIHSKKGKKYSDLLPLLGLGSLEVAAENLRQLAKTIQDVSKLAANRAKLQQLKVSRKQVFEDDTDEEILAKIKRLHSKYCPDNAETIDPLAQCKELKEAIDARLAESGAENRRYNLLRAIAELDLKGNISAVRDANSALAGAAELLITEKLQVLTSAEVFASKLEEETDIDCPACGRSIEVEHFKSHLEEEHARLADMIELNGVRLSAIGAVCDSVRILQTTLAKSELKSWREQLSEGPRANNLEYLDSIDTEKLRSSCGEQELKELEENLQPLIDAAENASKIAPPDAKELSEDKKALDVATEILEGKKLTAEVNRAEALVGFINALEEGVREEVRLQAKAVIDAISVDIQDMWSVLHPDEPIDNVRLYLPPETVKAIDIGLKFHGLDQASPMLTLSEGHRNSLGLCIFLAMAKREATNDRPIFLDDVVVSFDQGHRVYIVDVLKKYFGDRQVLLLTHDREWFTELRYRLPKQQWQFKKLLPWESPQLGLRWSHKTTNLDEARELISTRPDAAAADARRVMDVELAIIAERLKSKMYYLRGEGNDARTGYQFLQRLAADAKKCFKEEVDGEYVKFEKAFGILDEARDLLVPLGNRGAHTFNMAPAEATKLIEACEKALECFECNKCGQSVCINHNESEEARQCGCGGLRWRYGKA